MYAVCLVVLPWPDVLSGDCWIGYPVPESWESGEGMTPGLSGEVGLAACGRFKLGIRPSGGEGRDEAIRMEVVDLTCCLYY